MEINSKTRLIGLFGNPSRHSLSPLIQNAFLKYYDINCAYVVFEPTHDNLQKAFEGAENLGFVGLNVTMPFKEKIYNFVDRAEGSAEIIQAVNTVKFFSNYNENKKSENKNGKLFSSVGYSTDGDGLVRSLEDKGFRWNDKTCLIIGAGGAAKSTIFEIAKKNINHIFIYDIEIEKSRNLAKIILKYLNNRVNIIVLKTINEAEKMLDSISLIINCTPAGMSIADNPENINIVPVPDYWNLKDKFIFDMVYNPFETKFLNKAVHDKAKAAISGIYMLINQAAYAFNIWFGIMPDKKICQQIINMITDNKLCTLA